MSPDLEHEECQVTLDRIASVMRGAGEFASPAAAEPRIASFPQREPQAPRRARSARVALFSLTLRGTLALLVLYGLLFNFSVVRGSSMSPSIFDGDRILIDHFSYLFAEVNHGDIIVLQYPLDPKLDYIKRVVGLPGDEVLIESGRVFVNGERLHESYVDVPDLRSKLHTIVKPEHVFVLGDNRCHSSDSREFGQVPMENLLGKVDLRVWPLGRIGLIE